MNAVPPGVLRHLRKLVKLHVVEYPDDAERPRTRGDCASGERPCPWISCRQHLAVNVTPKGNVRIDERWEAGTMPETCALDVAERGEHTLEEIGNIVGFTRERVRQVQEIALRKAFPVADPVALEGSRDVVVELPVRLRSLR
jgi:hypothetical protein